MPPEKKSKHKIIKRSFSSYGPIDTNIHYYAPREELINSCLNQLIGKNPDFSGHYITVWAPRQTGKTWLMNKVLSDLCIDKRFDVVKIEMEIFKNEKNIENVLTYIEKDIARVLNRKIYGADTLIKFQDLFSKNSLEKNLILILDEFDSLEENIISSIVSVFRNIYNIRQSQNHKKTNEKDFLLHSVALIGIRSVLGVENVKGSPFNIQRSVHIPNFTFNEVEQLFKWHEKETGQIVDHEVIERLFYETNGQPGLTCWFGELITEGWNEFRVNKDIRIDMELFNDAYSAATCLLPNNNILNIISKAKKDPYKKTVLELFGTKEKITFTYDKNDLNFLYMNGVIDIEKDKDKKLYSKFSCPFIQKRLFNYFTDDIFNLIDNLYDPFDDIDKAVNENAINIKSIMNLYQKYLLKNNDWILKHAPRRYDMRVYEAIFHFNLYMYISRFIRRFKGDVYPEFPTGNGKIDLIIKYAGKTYGIEVKSYTDRHGYKKALKQAAKYGNKLELKEIFLIFFIENINSENRKKYEIDFIDSITGLKVVPLFIETGEQG